MNAKMMVEYWSGLEAEYRNAWLDGRGSVELWILATEQVKQWRSLVGE